MISETLWEFRQSESMECIVSHGLRTVGKFYVGTREAAAVREMYELVYWLANGDTRKAAAPTLAKLRKDAQRIIRGLP